MCFAVSPYHNRQPRRNSSPTSNVAAIQQPKLPQLQLHHPQFEEGNQAYHPAHLVEETDDGTTTCSHVSPAGNNGSNKENASVPLVTTNNDNEHHGQEQQQVTHNKKVKKNNNGSRNNVPGSLAHHNSQYYGTIPPRRVGRHSAVAPAEANLVASSDTNTVGAFLPLKCGAVIVPHLKKREYVQLPGKDEADYKDECEKDSSVTSNEKMNKWKNCSDVDDGSLRRKLLLQKQYQQKLQLQQQHKNHHRLSTEPPGELFKMKHTVSEEIPYYISTQ